MNDLPDGSKFFSKMDLSTDFHEIGVQPEDVYKNTFNTNYCPFRCLVLPMGLENGPATFVTLMNTVLQEFIDQFCLVYMDAAVSIPVLR